MLIFRIATSNLRCLFVTLYFNQKYKVDLMPNSAIFGINNFISAQVIF